MNNLEKRMRDQAHEIMATRFSSVPENALCLAIAMGYRMASDDYEAGKLEVLNLNNDELREHFTK